MLAQQVWAFEHQVLHPLPLILVDLKRWSCRPWRDRCHMRSLDDTQCHIQKATGENMSLHGHISILTQATGGEATQQHFDLESSALSSRWGHLWFSSSMVRSRATERAFSQKENAHKNRAKWKKYLPSMVLGKFYSQNMWSQEGWSGLQQLEEHRQHQVNLRGQHSATTHNT